MKRLAPLACLSLLAAVAVAQEPVPKSDERAGRLKEMRELIGTIRVTDPSLPPREALVREAEPLHRWNDPTRDFSDGSLWAFGAKGRPLALGTMELYGNAREGSVWSYELISLAPGPIEGESAGKYVPLGSSLAPGLGGPLRWSPKKPGVEMIAVADPPTAGATEAERLRQMKNIAARLSAREIRISEQDAQQYELRLLPRPIHRYADPASGLIDGTIFLLAYGTNPEALVLIEARRGTGGAVSWSCGFERLSRAGLSASLDGKEIWTRPFVEAPSADETYFIVRALRGKQE